MALSFLKGMGKSDVKALGQALEGVKVFVKINDSLKRQRFEWIFGVPQIGLSPNKAKQGVHNVDITADEYCKFKSGLMKVGQSDAYLGLLYQAKRKGMDSQCLAGVLNLVEMMAADEELARYIFDQPAPSVQGARYWDWVMFHTEQKLTETQNTMKNVVQASDYNKKKLDVINKILELRPTVEKMLAPWVQEQEEQLAKESVGTSEFVGYLEHTLVGQEEGILKAYPPPYLVGAPKPGVANRVLLTEETELATVTLEEVTTEFMFSNPNQIFNLSLPDLQWRNTTTFSNMGYRAWKILNMRTSGGFTGPGAEADKFIVTRPWRELKREAPVMLAVMIKSKA